MKRLFLSLVIFSCLASTAEAQVSGTSSAPIIGTWTPTLIGSSGGTAALSVAVGSYVNTGTWWQANAVITASSITGLTGNAQIGSLPWTQRNTANDVGECSITTYNNITATAIIQGATIQPNATVASIIATVVPASQPAAAVGLPVSTLTATTSISLSCSGHT